MNTPTPIHDPANVTSKYAWREFRLQCVREDAVLQPLLTLEEEVANFLRKRFLSMNPDAEAFVVFALNRKGRVIGWQVTSVGTANSTLVHPREVFRFAVMAGASAIIVAHNHPSGDPAPSAADVRITRILGDAARVVDIELLDHVIVGDVRMDPSELGYYSFRKSGII